MTDRIPVGELPVRDGAAGNEDPPHHGARKGALVLADDAAAAREASEGGEVIGKTKARLIGE
jgi:hypothetical protein